MNISPRLHKIIDTIEPCGTLADIGCDHGYVAISALKQGKAERAIAADVAKGPLDIAARNCKSEGVAGRVELILSDGFKSIPDAADINCAVIAGMGGLLMERILREAFLTRFPNLHQLVLSPQSDLDAVRRLLIEELRFVIRTEYMVLDEGKYYYIMDVQVPAALPTPSLEGTQECTFKDIIGTQHSCNIKECSGKDITSRGCEADEPGSTGTYTEAEYMFGKDIATESGDIYMEFLGHRKAIVTEALSKAALGTSESAKDKADKLRTELSMIEEAESKQLK